ncbi:unnamed protein product [Notodromas monacha]|uniref:Glucose-methanol-choline oxidoreductase N-terminal domain-containing protein n=1 Tax=Notodromas monacha TaxID=399045 RepID=A0A7R9BE81_9CRUS|nr:unnamed protein product [Notodromas monacha]CAG0913766.1 unnamed protein product [Notodromas monacha]
MAIFSFLTWPLALMGLIVVGFRTMMNDVDDPIGHRMLGPRTITPVYDFIIVGGGTSGAVLANRLTEDPDTRVLLLEAGSDGSYLSEVPAFPFLLWNTEMDWHYFSEPQSDSCLAFQGSRCVWFRGKMLGGSSALNGGVYARGNPKDYDNWERLGNSGWSWQDVFPLFRKSEDFKKRDNRGGIALTSAEMKGFFT